MTALSVFAAGLIPDPAAAATPPYMFSPGTYPLTTYDSGTPHNGTLVVSDAGSYVQTWNFASGPLEVWLVPSFQSSTPDYVFMTDLYLGGLYFKPVPDVLGNVYPSLYRPYQPGGLFQPTQHFVFTMRSTSGGVTIHGDSTVAAPGFVRAGGQNVLVQRIDTTITFSGNGSGSLNVIHWEAIGNPSRSRDEYFGSVSILGSNYPVYASAVLGGLES